MCIKGIGVIMAFSKRRADPTQFASGLFWRITFKFTFSDSLLLLAEKSLPAGKA
jgi:hypothetical protein